MLLYGIIFIGIIVIPVLLIWHISCNTSDKEPQRKEEYYRPPRKGRELCFNPKCRKCIHYRSCLKDEVTSKDVMNNSIWFCNTYYCDKRKNKGKTKIGLPNGLPNG